MSPACICAPLTSLGCASPPVRLNPLPEVLARSTCFQFSPSLVTPLAYSNFRGCSLRDLEGVLLLYSKRRKGRKQVKTAWNVAHSLLVVYGRNAHHSVDAFSVEPVA
ncbi:unnamed protein product [Citrullus colocynthis]|uniref:Uncharacterized protein n=1 Tax=Citrullus colocynthis TaxID=252529 RepID=A0ABP0YD55_9ROSI